MTGDIPSTKRLTIIFDGLTIKADIEPGATLPQALRGIAKSQEQLEAGDCEEVTDFDE